MKSIAITHGDARAHGDAIVTKDGLEGTPVYRLGARVRDGLARGPVTVHLDLKADSDLAALQHRLERGATGFSSSARSRSS